MNRCLTFPSYALSILAALMLSLSLGACDDDGLSNTVFPRLEVNPEAVVLPAVPQGETTFKTLTVRNAGGGRLRINDMYFSNTLSAMEFQKAHDPTPLVLEAGEQITVRIDYAPQDTGSDQGALLIESTDDANPTFRVPITTANSETNLLVNPDQLVFNDAEIGGSQTLSVELRSLGSVPIVILDVSLHEDTDPQYTLGDDTDARPTLGQDERVSYSVVWRPTDYSVDDGILIITTDDPNNAQIFVPLTGTLPSPDIEVAPPAINFGAVDLGTPSEQETVVIMNRGTQTLTVTEIGFAFAPPPINDQFEIHDLPAFPLEIPSEGEFRFSVSYNPNVEDTHVTALAIRSDDPDEGVVTVPLSGRVRRKCIAVNPPLIDFGAVALNQDSARNQVQVVNCGDLPLNLSEITIDDEDFDWAPMGGGDRADIVLEPLGALGLEVWYHNDGLPEGALARATLTIHNDVPDQGTYEVPLNVVGGGAPTCQLIILPPAVNYGLVSRGRTVTKDLRVLNRGTGMCEVRSQEIVPVILIPIPGFDQVRFFLTRPIPNGVIPPLGEPVAQVTYRPEVFMADSAIYRVTFWDPFLNEERSVDARLNGVGGESNIEVIPGHLDFGNVTAGECASQTERVTVYNTGTVNLCITDIRFEGDGCGEFFIVDRPVADDDGCIIVSRNQPADVHLVYEPDDLGEDLCNLVFVSDDADNPRLNVPLTGAGIRDSQQTDVFVQTSGQTVDILFIVDNSGSMGEEQQNLQRNFASFIQGAQQFANDYQIGIVTTDMDADDEKGRLQGNPRIMARSPNVEPQFNDAVDVGSSGSGEEKGLAAAHAALSDPLAFDTGVACNADADCVEPDRCVSGFCGGHNRGFLREEAALEVVFVSDEDDFSAGTLNFYVDFLKNIKGFRNEGRFHAHAIVGAENGRASACTSNDGDASAGRRYVEVADRTNGGVYSICDGSFGNSLRAIGNQAFGLPVQFFLSRPALEASITVTVDGVPAHAWSYDQDSNSIIFDEGAVPQPNQTITVQYEAQCFPREN